MASGRRTEVGYLRIKSAKSCTDNSREILNVCTAVSKALDSRTSAANASRALNASANRIKNHRVKRAMHAKCSRGEAAAKRRKSWWHGHLARANKLCGGGHRRAFQHRAQIFSR